MENDHLSDLHNRNVKFQTSVPIVADSVSQHRTFMDTLGRTTLTLTAVNVIDESRDADLLVSPIQVSKKVQWKLIGFYRYLMSIL